MTIPIHVRYSARSDNQAASLIIGCQPYEVPRLASVGLVSYLNPDCRFAVKYCATVALLRLTSDPKWQLIATTFLKGGDWSALTSPGTFSTKKRARGLAREETKPEATIGGGQWMIDAMLASMAFDRSRGMFLSATIGDEEVARILGFRKHDLPPLRRAKVLACLNPENGRACKMHSRDEILRLVADEEWLAKATITINQHWKAKNARKSKGRARI